MHQFWIPASKALSFIAREMGDYPAILAICERAHAGLLASKAQLYIAPDQRLEQIPIPTEFWWAEGHEALEQDWVRGDFSTWIDRRYRLQAFGVAFDFEGLRLMLSTEAAAAALRELSVSFRPNDAIRRMFAFAPFRMVRCAAACDGPSRASRENGYGTIC